jgi:hypothetical protein
MGALSSFTGDPVGYVKEGSENQHLSPEGSRWGTWKGPYLLGDFDRQTMEDSTDKDNLVYVSTQHILLHVHALCIQPYTFVMCII